MVCQWHKKNRYCGPLDLRTSDIQSIEYKERGFTFGIAPKVTKSLGPKPPKAEKPDDIPKIGKLAHAQTVRIS